MLLLTRFVERRADAVPCRAHKHSQKGKSLGPGLADLLAPAAAAAAPEVVAGAAAAPAAASVAASSRSSAASPRLAAASA